VWLTLRCSTYNLNALGGRSPRSNIDPHKQRVAKKALSEYLAEFLLDNPALPGTLQSHLIKDTAIASAKGDDYDVSIQHRAKAIALALNVKLLPMTVAEVADEEAKV